MNKGDLIRLKFNVKGYSVDLEESMGIKYKCTRELTRHHYYYLDSVDDRLNYYRITYCEFSDFLKDDYKKHIRSFEFPKRSIVNLINLEANKDAQPVLLKYKSVLRKRKLKYILGKKLLENCNYIKTTSIIRDYSCWYKDEQLLNDLFPGVIYYIEDLVEYDEYYDFKYKRIIETFINVKKSKVVSFQFSKNDLDKLIDFSKDEESKKFYDYFKPEFRKYRLNKFFNE